MSALGDAVWALLGLFAVALWAVSYREPDRVARPGALVAAAMSSRGGRVLLLVAWMFAGWHFFAR